ncbi:hypothetical protein MSPP1_000334 [Malassezia sp. CBS 17886]|nr:hypothetical protein MSPP1_000334 [Malassezia sp. CBS 17886]
MDDGCVAALTTFLRTPGRPCVDLRATALFGKGHIAHAVHVSGLSSLRSRFSTLPARGVPFLVVCAAAEVCDVADVFQPRERWHIIAVLGIAEGGEPRGEPSPHAPTAHASWTVPRDAFQAWATQAALWRTGGTRVLDRVHAAEDAPRLLFAPAPVVRRALDMWPSGARRGAVRVLDLGCGAGRDVTYILAHFREQACRRAEKVAPPLHATLLDRWAAALGRAELLLRDNVLMGDDACDGARCEAILCCDVGEDGRLAVRGEAGAAPQPLSRSTLASPAFDVVLVIRFWPWALLQTLPAIVAPGGIVVLSHFVHEPRRVENTVVADDARVFDPYLSPPAHARIQPGDVARLLDTWEGPWSVLQDRIEPIEDGRPVQSVILRREPPRTDRGEA